MTAKRAIWIIRAVLYPSLALAAVLLLLHRGGESEADGGPTTLYGRTAEGHYFSAGFFEGRVSASARSSSSAVLTAAHA